MKITYLREGPILHLFGESFYRCLIVPADDPIYMKLVEDGTITRAIGDPFENFCLSADFDGDPEGNIISGGVDLLKIIREAGSTTSP